ncbi:MAG: damage-control phosphatase ARMT1 family protein [Anaerolineae bacterium]
MRDDDTDVLPPPLMTSEPGSFARKTIVERKPQIIRRVIDDHDYPPEIVEALERFREEIARKMVQPLQEIKGDAAFWNEHQAKYKGRTWLQLPWFFAETYFYRKLLEATRYFQPGPRYHDDPFAPQKREQEANAVRELTAGWQEIAQVAPDRRFAPLLHACLWGNRADLSNFTVRERAIGDTTVDRVNILIDDTDQVRDLLSGGVDQVAFINDNVGADSLFDLVLADYLLDQGWARQVVFHLKNQPFFVSDAMPQDIRHMIMRVQTSEERRVATLGDRLNTAVRKNDLVLTTAPYWSRCLSFHEMPGTTRAQLARADLVIIKGDVNYRRLLDDRHWPHETPLEAITGYFPAPFLVLRTLKGELVVGLEAGEAEELAAEDPDWLINGKRGLVQLVGTKRQD